MTLCIDTVTGNREPSSKLKQMLLDFRSNTGAWLDSIEEIEEQARKEGFNEQQTILLIRQHFPKDDKTRRRLKYVLYERPRLKKQRNLRDDLAKIGQGANMSMEQEEKISIPTDYTVVVPDQVLEEETKQLEQEEHDNAESNEIESVANEGLRQEPNYETENLKMQLDGSNNKVTELTTQIKNWEEKYKQLEARTMVSPSNNFPALHGNTLRTKIVVNRLFREILVLKGSKVIYANIAIDTSQNKYVRLEPL